MVLDLRSTLVLSFYIDAVLILPVEVMIEYPVDEAP